MIKPVSLSDKWAQCVHPTSNLSLKWQDDDKSLITGVLQVFPISATHTREENAHLPWWSCSRKGCLNGQESSLASWMSSCRCLQTKHSHTGCNNERQVKDSYQIMKKARWNMCTPTKLDAIQPFQLELQYATWEFSEVQISPAQTINLSSLNIRDVNSLCVFVSV